MSDFLDSAKNFVNSAVSRTSWEAQKQLRIRGKQGEIDKLLEQRSQLVGELSQTAMSLYQQGALTDQQLSRLCASIFELDHDLRTHETQIQDLKNEAYPADQFAQGPTANYAPPSGSMGGTYSAGAPGGSTGPTGSAGSAAPARCPNCGNALRPSVLYCRSCGAKVS
jgi:hypothetical protein